MTNGLGMLTPVTGTDILRNSLNYVWPVKPSLDQLDCLLFFQNDQPVLSRVRFRVSKSLS